MAHVNRPVLSLLTQALLLTVGLFPAVGRCEQVTLYSKSKRSAHISKVSVNTSSLQPHLLKLHFGDETRILELSRNNDSIFASSRVHAGKLNAFNVIMVLNDTTKEPLILPNDNKLSINNDEYKFFIRGHYVRKFVCMNAVAKVYLTEKERNSLPEDCLWRGKILPTANQNGASYNQEVVFYHAFYPNAHNRWLSKKKRRWYLSFDRQFHKPQEGFIPNGRSNSVKFSVALLRLQTNDSRSLGMYVSNPTIKLGDGKRVGISNQPLNAVMQQHAKRKYNSTGCSEGNQLLLDFRRHRARLLKKLKQVSLLKEKVRRVAEERLTDKRARRLSETLHRYLRHMMSEHFLARGNCRYRELTLAFQSALVARSVLRHKICTAGASAKKFKWRMNRRHRKLQRSLRRQLKSLGPRRHHRGRRLLTLLRRQFNVSLGNLRDLQTAHLLRRQRTKEEKRLTDLYNSTNPNDKRVVQNYIRAFFDTDAVKFFIILNDRGARRMVQKKDSLVSDRQFRAMRRRWGRFPVFYFDMKCRRPE